MPPLAQIAFGDDVAFGSFEFGFGEKIEKLFGGDQGVDFAADVIADCHEACKRKDAMKAKGFWLP